MTDQTRLDFGPLEGRHIRLEPLHPRHVDGLSAAAAQDPSLYRWTPVPAGRAAMAAYVETALRSRRDAAAAPFAIVRRADGAILGSTRFWNLERWAWPADNPRAAGAGVDGCEIGYTWLAAIALRTAANTESKLLMLDHAFEGWRALRVCFHTDVRNRRSAAAMERIGCSFEGVLRAHRLAADNVARDSARYSILAEEWPALRERLRRRLDRP